MRVILSIFVQQFVLLPGAPNFYEDTFTAEPGDSSNSDFRITSGVLTLNGKVLFDHDDFKHQTYILETPVILQEINSLRVELESKPENYISLEVIQTLPDPVYDILASDLVVDAGNWPCPCFRFSIDNAGTVIWTSLLLS